MPELVTVCPLAPLVVHGHGHERSFHVSAREVLILLSDYHRR